MVVGDLDNCVTKGAVIDPWAQEIINLDNTYAEISTSGTGVRILMAREAGDDAHSSGEANGVGFFANGGRGAVLTFNALPGRFVERITPSTALKRAVLNRKGHTEGAATSTIETDVTLDELADRTGAYPQRWRVGGTTTGSRSAM